MAISVFDLFKVGIGPSSSHTVGPMKAARMFAGGLRDEGLLPSVRTVRVCLYGSLGLTGKGHGSDKAVLLGLEGEQPATVDVDAIPARLEAMAARGTLRLLGEHEISVHRRRAPGVQPQAEAQLPPQRDALHRLRRPRLGGSRARLLLGRRRLRHGRDGNRTAACGTGRLCPAYPFSTAAELLAHTARSGLPVSAIMLANEQALGQTSAQVRDGLRELWQVDAGVRATAGAPPTACSRAG